MNLLLASLNAFRFSYFLQYLPHSFASSCFEEKSQTVTLQVCKRSWPVKLLAYPFWSYIFSKGWSAFVRESSPSPGDVCIFELIKKNRVVVNVSVFRKKKFIDQMFIVWAKLRNHFVSCSIFETSLLHILRGIGKAEYIGLRFVERVVVSAHLCLERLIVDSWHLLFLVPKYLSLSISIYKFFSSFCLWCLLLNATWKTNTWVLNILRTNIFILLLNYASLKMTLTW